MVKQKTLTRLLKEFEEFKINMIHLNGGYIEKEDGVIKFIKNDELIPAIRYEEKLDLEKATRLIEFELKFRSKFFKNCYDYSDDEGEDDDE
jgi:hypothetical protein